MNSNISKRINYEEISEVENIIDSLIKLVEEKEQFIEGQVNKISELKNNKESLVVPLKIMNIQLSYTLLLTYSKYEMFDEISKILDTITAEDINKLKLNNKEQILKCIIKYLNNFNKNTDTNTLGINNILSFILSGDISEELNKILIKIFMNDKYLLIISKSNVLLYLIKLFLNDYHTESKELFKLIINKKYYVEYSHKELINLLMIRAYYTEFNKVNDNLYSFIKSNTNKEINYLRNLNENKDKGILYYLNFEDITNNIKECNIDIAKKLYEFYMANRREIEDIYINKNNKCDYDNNDLKTIKAIIPIYNIIENKKTRILQTDVLWCKCCNKYSLTTKLLENIYKLLNVNEGIKYKSLNGLNLKSQLMILGYNTNVDRERRWELLQNRIVPTLGYNKVFNHINFLINLNKNKVNKDFSRSLTEWNHDLSKLRNRYYK